VGWRDSQIATGLGERVVQILDVGRITIGRLRFSGMLPSHYAPSLPLRLKATDARPGEALLAFGPNAPFGFAKVLYLSHTGDLAEAAANLFAMRAG
jgi:hypothetical protein